MVVVGLPAVAGQHVAALEAGFDEWRVVDRKQVDVHAEVLLPLRLEELRARDVQRVVGIVRVLQAGDSGRSAVRLQELLGLRCVECGQRVGAVHVTDQRRRNESAGRRGANDALAHGLDQCVLVDGQRERKAQVLGLVTAAQQERTLRGPRRVGDHVEAHPVGANFRVNHQLS